MRVFITGGTTGIGFGLCELYLKEGHQVGICGRSLAKLPQGFIEKFPNLKCYELDVLDKESFKHAVADFSKGELDLIIGNAGISGRKDATVIDFQKAGEILNTNIFGVLNTFEVGLSEFLPRKKGQIVVIASVAGFVGLPWAPAYSASKAAVLKLGESLAISLKNDGILVTTIAPGFIDTPLTRKNKNKMPFLLTLEDGAKRIKNAIDKIA
jgi:NAD(P)-dependent dehydrogenase (short-subunit alcohol dehydrogenase family)